MSAADIKGGLATATAALTMGGVGYAAMRKSRPVAGALAGAALGSGIIGALAAGLFDCCEDLRKCEVRFP